MPTLVQFDFPMQGPWGDELAVGGAREEQPGVVPDLAVDRPGWTLHVVNARTAA